VDWGQVLLTPISACEPGEAPRRDRPGDPDERPDHTGTNEIVIPRDAGLLAMTGLGLSARYDSLSRPDAPPSFSKHFTKSWFSPWNFSLPFIPGSVLSGN
jgi:hypothetical protein